MRSNITFFENEIIIFYGVMSTETNISQVCYFSLKSVLFYFIDRKIFSKNAVPDIKVKPTNGIVRSQGLISRILNFPVSKMFLRQ